MKTIIPNLSSKLTNETLQSKKFPQNLSKMWIKILNLERTLFPALIEELRYNTPINKTN